MKSDTHNQLSGVKLDKRNSPLISIGLPTYNGEKRISTTIRSILSQNYPNLEVIISDNCSLDNTESVCTKLCKENPMIRYFRQEKNIGIMPNFEFVLGKASGELFMWIADDDSLELGILYKYADFLSTHPDHSLVSGQIRYWTGTQLEFDEAGFNIGHRLPGLRVLQFYSRVKYGSIIYGLMPTQIARQIELQNRMGEDWHFVAKAAYLGKIKMFECIGYHKQLNGSSKTLKQYARIIGAPWFPTHFPHAQIAVDAFLEILRSPVYSEKPIYSRLALAMCTMVGILFNHYCIECFFIVGGKIRRVLGFKKRIRPSSPYIRRVTSFLAWLVDASAEL